MIPSTLLPGLTDRICGSIFAPVDASTTPGTVIGDAENPFTVLTHTAATIGAAATTAMSGYSLDYTQIPC